MAVFICMPLGWGMVLGLVLAKLDSPFPGWMVASLLSVSLGGITAAWILGRKREVALLCFGVGLALGWLLWQNSQLPNEYEGLYGQEIRLEAVVVDRPTITQSGNQAIVMRPLGFSQYIRASLFNHAYVKVGDRILVQGELKRPENFEDFDYVNYLKQRNVYSELAKPQVIVVNSAEHSMSSLLEEFRQKAIRHVEVSLPEPSSAIMLGMLIGERDRLPPGIEESFRKTGLIHVLVVSGFNLTIIASSIGISARLFGRRRADCFSLALIWLFVFLVGASSAVVRAGIMASLLILARLFGRLAMSSFSLLLAVMLMVIIDPLQLFYDIGFQLSVAATWGVLQANALRAMLEKDGWLGEVLWPSLGAILATAPIVANYFGTFSVIAPVANLVVLPLIPYTMLCGALALVPGIGIAFIPLTELLIDVQLQIVSFLSRWKYSQLELAIHPSMIISYYVMLILILQAILRTQKSRLIKYRVNDTITKIII